MKIIGLTGQSGSGKGTVGVILKKHGIPTVDTDNIYHDILRGGGACTAELVEAFGVGILDERGIVDRKKLASCVFGKKETPALLHTLNGITHKYVMSETRNLLSEFEKNRVKTVAIDAPLLFEAKMDTWCDAVIGVLAAESLRIQRIMARDAITEENARLRIKAQQPDEFYHARCHLVLENNGSMEELEEKISTFLKDFEI